MSRFYILVRVVGYVAGVAGMVLFMLGRQSANPRGPLFMAGAVLILVSFAAFFASYILYVFQRLSRR